LEFGQGFTTYIVWLKLYYFIDLIMCGVKFWQANSAFLCDIHLLMGLTCVLSIMETMQSLLKFARWQDNFICDFIATMKIYKGQFYFKYYDNLQIFGVMSSGLFMDYCKGIIHKFTWNG
jgi:hypothetical protein